MTAFNARLFSAEERASFGLGRRMSCFYCANPLKRHAVIWKGCGPILVLHRHCATKLALALIIDAEDVRRAIETRPRSRRGRRACST